MSSHIAGLVFGLFCIAPSLVFFLIKEDMENKDEEKWWEDLQSKLTDWETSNDADNRC